MSFLDPPVYEDALITPYYIFYNGGFVGHGQGQVAGQYSTIQLELLPTGAPNPDDLLVIDQITVISDSLQLCRIGTGALVAGTTLQARSSDTRTGAQGTGAGGVLPVRLVAATQVAAFPGIKYGDIWSPQRVPIIVPGPFLISGRNNPGAFQVYSGVPNVTLYVFFKFRLFRQRGGVERPGGEFYGGFDPAGDPFTGTIPSPPRP